TTANARTRGARPSGVGHTPQVWSASAVGPEPASTGGGTDTARATGRSRGTASASATTSRRNRTRRRRQTRVDIEKQVRRPKCPFLHGLPTLSANGGPAAPPLLLAFRRRPLERMAGHRVGVRLGEPDVSVGPGGDPLQLAVAAADGEVLHVARRRDPPDPVRAEVGEPEVPVAGGHDALGGALLAPDHELGDDPVGRDAADLAGVVLGEPDVAVGPDGDV